MNTSHTKARRHEGLLEGPPNVEAAARRFSRKNTSVKMPLLHSCHSNLPLQNTPRAAFTLVELLVSMAVLTVLMLILLSMTSATQKTWTYTTGKVEQFREAREAFESLTRRLSQATLNTYWDYDNPTTPTKYLRQSELRFISGPGLAGSATTTPPRPTHSIFFQAPLGFTDNSTYASLENLLNTWGFYIEFADDSPFRPSFITSAARSRFRLMELMEPSESLTLYTHTSGNQTYNGTDWFDTPLGDSSIPKRPIAENVIALVILPKLSPNDQAAGSYTNASLAPNYTYDSTTTKADKNLNPKNQLPPILQVTMVAIDEASANRLSAADNNAIQSTLGGLFSDASKYSTDLTTLETFLSGKNISYRVFTTNVSIKAAKWSREQVN